MPTYLSFVGPKPDYPASPDGVVPAGYRTFPRQLVKSVAAAPGSGGTVQLYTYASQAPPSPLAQNRAWQQVNKALNVNLQIPIIDLVDYNTKLATTIAGGNIPDILSVNVLGQTIQGELDFFTSKCADLTSYLSGDAIKAYPNLANFPPLSWKPCVFNNRFYALPRVVASVGTAMYVEQSRLDALGVTNFTSTADFTRVMKELTKAGSVYGLGGVQSTTLNYFLGVFRGPNNWQNAGGKLTKDWETEEYQHTVVYLRSLWDAGVVSPDTPTMRGPSGAAEFYAGKFALYPSDFFVYHIVWDRIMSLANKAFKPRVLPVFGHDGGKGVQFQSSGVSQLTVFNKAPDARIKELLGVLNYLAAPFGSQEYLLLNYGIEGTDFTFDSSGNPVPTKAGPMDIHVPWGDVASPPAVFYYPKSPAFAQIANQEAAAAHALAITDPTVGLYSPTLLEKGAVLNKTFTDGVNQILYGRADVNTLDQLVKDWRSGGGNQIRNELEAALQRAPQ